MTESKNVIDKKTINRIISDYFESGVEQDFDFIDKACESDDNCKIHRRSKKY